MTPAEDSYRPREHDHLVEPMFGGLGVSEEGRERAVEEEQPSVRRGWIARLLGVLGLRR